MTLFRIVRRAYADLSGAGGLFYAGRWHEKGHPIIYAAGSVALAALEYAVHTSIRPVDTVLMEIQAPDGSCVTIEDRMGGELPGNWAFVQEQSRHLGSEWLTGRETLMLSVPSVVIPFERNLLLNPLHISFESVHMKKSGPLLL